jgi:tellurite resistance protein
MYAGIESDVNKYSTALLRLRNELPVYNSKFPNEAAAMQKYSNTIEREIRRSDLLKKQIAAAKQIALLYEYQQGPAWRSEMLPILEAEDALDKSK